MYSLEPLLDLLQPARVEIEATAVVTQAIHRLLNLDQRRVKNVQRFLQARIVCRRSVEARHHRTDSRQCCCFAFRQSFDGVFHRLQQAGCIR